MQNMWSSFIDSIAQNVQGQEKQEHDYIGEDGLLYCGDCHTRKQMVISVVGEDRVVPVMCQCVKDKFQARDDEIKANEFNAAVTQMRKDCFPSVEMEKCTFAIDDHSNKKISNAMRNYVDKWEEVRAEKMGLLLYGNTGVGKTFYAACIANALIDKGVAVKMASFAKIVNTMYGMSEGRQDYMTKLVNYPLLIIDDLGAERNSDYMMEQVYSLVDARYQTEKPFIITTNIPIEEIKDPSDLKYKRIYDRILERCFPVKIEGKSRRRESLKENFAHRKSLLGL